MNIMETVDDGTMATHLTAKQNRLEAKELKRSVAAHASAFEVLTDAPEYDHSHWQTVAAKYLGFIEHSRSGIASDLL